MADQDAWRVLIVDDEEDIHAITKVALRTQRWRGRSFSLLSALSGAEARKLLSSPQGQGVHVALVDVVMETNDAGLELCKFIRETQPPSLRIILRTGQPGHAPVEKVLNDYDIDYYMAKPEVTKESLYNVIRACLRSSQDISTQLAVRAQLRRFAELMEDVAGLGAFLEVMASGLGFLAEKHKAKILFFNDLDFQGAATGRDNLAQGGDAAELADRALSALRAARAASPTPLSWVSVPGQDSPNTRLMIVPTLEMEATRSAAPPSLWSRVRGVFGAKVWTPQPVTGGVCAVFAEEPIPEKALADLKYDLAPFLENWKIAHRVFRWHGEVAQRRAQLEHAAGGGSPF